MIVLPSKIENKKVILDAIKTEIKSINNDINSQNELKRKIVSYFRDFVYHIDFLQLDYISDSLKNIVSYLDISDATLDIYEALLAQVYDIRVQVKKNSDIDKYKKLIDIYNKKYEDQAKIITSNENKINGLFSTSFSEIHTDTENLENTLVIDEINSQVILPYNLKDIYNLLKTDTKYNTIHDAVNAIYRKPLSHYKNAPIARFREAYNLIKEREHGTTKEAVDLGLELMFNGKLHPAIITSCRTLDQLDIYLSCLEYNELDDFHFFKVLYKALPESKKKKGFLKSKFSGQLQKVLEQSKELITNKIQARNDIFSSAEKDFENKLEEIKQKHDTSLTVQNHENIFNITGYKTLFFDSEIVDEIPSFSITGYKTFAIQKPIVPEVKEVVPEVKEIVQEPEIKEDISTPKAKKRVQLPKVKKPIQVPKTNSSKKIAKTEITVPKIEQVSKKDLDALIDSIQDNYNGTRHTRIEKDIMEVVEEKKKELKQSNKVTIIKATTMRTSDNVEKDRKIEEARIASLRKITGARTIQFPKKNLFTITGCKTMELQSKVQLFTITGFKTIKLEEKLQLFTITGYRTFQLQQPLFKITGYRTMYFGIGDVDESDVEKNIEEALHSLSEPTSEPLYNQVSDVIGKLKQIQANSKYYYVPPTENQEKEIVETSKEESTEEAVEAEHDNFSDRFNISVINTTLKKDPLLSEIESLDDFDTEESNHNSLSNTDNMEDERLHNEKSNEEIPLVKSIRRSRKKASVHR